jgi:hypothetical protein
MIGSEKRFVMVAPEGLGSRSAFRMLPEIPTPLIFLLRDPGANVE